MNLTAIDAPTALSVVDLQQGFIAALCFKTVGPIVARSRALAEVLRRHHLPGFR